MDSKQFQYILCYGSTHTFSETPPPYPHFNTSYVTVQRNLNLYWKRKHQNFNTSYVTVQRRSQPHRHTDTQDFNTSYVTVQREIRRLSNLPKRISIHPMLRFNEPKTIL